MTETNSAADADTERATWPAIARGLVRRCPNCGEGAMFDGYLKVRDRCETCDEALYHHRADDGPAYLTILVVGHIMGFLLHFMWVYWRPTPLMMFAVLGTACVVASLLLLPRLKGMIVAIQWARRMHGFGGAR